VDSLTLSRLTRELVDIDSTTGREGEAGAFLVSTLRQLGYSVEEQPVSPGRFNVFATLGEPALVFSTHFDCVPPFFPSREADDRVYGRGACDAKGIAVAQIAAAERLRRMGEARIGLLFVVGEERGSDGAKLANQRAPSSVRFLINGEPTGNRLAAATCGVYRVRLHASGVAAHSSQPELGDSAIDKLIDALVSLRGVEWPSAPDLGRTFYSVGLIKGGVASNVISPSAEAELMFRTVGPYEEVRDAIEARLKGAVSTEEVLVVPPVRLRTVSMLETAVFAFTTDVPFLDRWGTPLLVGPGSVAEAHTADEHIEVAELERAVEIYVQLARELIA
jgi:acetylornithine deacetylase